MLRTFTPPTDTTICQRQRVHPPTARGFTLVELMITIAVAVVLITIAVPSFKHIIASSKLTTTTNSLVGALHVARMEAIKRNADVQFCSNSSTLNGTDTLGTACGTQTGAVYVMTADSTGNPAAVQVRAGTHVAKGEQNLTGDVAALRFEPDGLAHAVGKAQPFTGVVANICSAALDSSNHRKVKMKTGTIIAVATTTGATCP